MIVSDQFSFIMHPRKRIWINYLLLYTVFHVLDMENEKKQGDLSRV